MGHAVTSRGASRCFVVAVLQHCLESTQQAHGRGESVNMPFDTAMIESWLVSAYQDCQNDATSTTQLQQLMGGTPFDGGDPTTYWTSPSQYLCWWKNNVERKSKFKSLSTDAAYRGSEGRARARALFCQCIIALALSIRNHFDRILSRHGGEVKLLPVPVPLPYGRNFRSTPQSPNDLGNRPNNRDKRRDHMEVEYEETLDSGGTSTEDGPSSVECIEFGLMGTDEVFGLSLHTVVEATMDSTKPQWVGFMEMPFLDTSSEETKERHIQLIDELMEIASPPPTPGSGVPRDAHFFENAVPPSAAGHQIDVGVEVTMCDGQPHSTSLGYWTMMMGRSY